MASVCVDPEYFDVGDDGRLTVVPGSADLRDILYCKTDGTFDCEKADYPWLARIFVQVQAAGEARPGRGRTPTNSPRTRAARAAGTRSG